MRELEQSEVTGQEVLHERPAQQGELTALREELARSRAEVFASVQTLAHEKTTHRRAVCEERQRCEQRLERERREAHAAIEAKLRSVQAMAQHLEQVSVAQRLALEVATERAEDASERLATADEELEVVERELRTVREDALRQTTEARELAEAWALEREGTVQQLEEARRAVHQEGRATEAERRRGERLVLELDNAQEALQRQAAEHASFGSRDAAMQKELEMAKAALAEAEQRLARREDKLADAESRAEASAEQGQVDVALVQVLEAQTEEMRQTETAAREQAEEIAKEHEEQMEHAWVQQRALSKELAAAGERAQEGEAALQQKLEEMQEALQRQAAKHASLGSRNSSLHRELEMVKAALAEAERKLSETEGVGIQDALLRKELEMVRKQLVEADHLRMGLAEMLALREQFETEHKQALFDAQAEALRQLEAASKEQVGLRDRMLGDLRSELKESKHALKELQLIDASAKTALAQATSRLEKADGQNASLCDELMLAKTEAGKAALLEQELALCWKALESSKAELETAWQEGEQAKGSEKMCADLQSRLEKSEE